MPIVDDLIDKTAGHQIMSFMDGFSGYNQIFIAEEDIHRTSFICPLGIFEWVVMPFGLKNAGATYQRAMNTIFDASLGKTVEVYIDDIVVKSTREDLHVNHLRNAFMKMRKHQLKLNPLKCAFGVKVGQFLGFLVHQRGIEVDQNKYLTHPPVLIPPQPGKPFILYVAATETTIGAMLAQVDENGRERAVYYLSRQLTPVEDRYAPKEKLCLSIFYAVMKLRHYIGRSEAYVVSKSPIIKYFFESPLLNGQISKWSLILSPYDLRYKSQQSIKGQALADFLVDHDPALSIDQEEATEEAWQAWFDSSSTMNGAGIGIHIIFPMGKDIRLAFRLQVIPTNNATEYEALTTVPNELLALKAKHACIKGDLQLVINQVNEECTCQGRLLPYLEIVQRLITGFELASFQFVGREENVVANSLAQLPFGQAEASNKLIKNNIQKMVGHNPKKWHEVLDDTLWALRVTRRESTGETPFALVYGHDAVLPIEMRYKSLGVSQPCLQDEAMHVALEELERKRLEVVDKGAQTKDSPPLK
ncbi:hypothetical protein MLD38_025506 [Melastoma candidum]|uniref:Uncharacterized protein n=1 Tax=Melastoma candidum TaxID=119954 RepID=A0ACB9P0R7_9MYRT|nr:hypothetical protein MLD38_025506 [Melastoma candidum]